MPEQQTNGNGAITWFRIAWPILSFIVLLALAGLAAVNEQGKDIAIMQTENGNLKTSLTEMESRNEKAHDELKTKLDSIIAILTNPVR